jgi:hypothetical protein
VLAGAGIALATHLERSGQTISGQDQDLERGVCHAPDVRQSNNVVSLRLSKGKISQ